MISHSTEVIFIKEATESAVDMKDWKILSQ